MSKDETNSQEPERRRLESIYEKLRAYKQQKTAIKAALSNIDKKPNSKIVFDDYDGESEEKIINDIPKENGKKQILFDSDGEEEEDYNFGVKKQFEGEEGEKLFMLQKKFKGDERFNLDERFLTNNEETNHVEHPREELTLEEEKRQEFDILGEVLGNTIKPNSLHKPKSKPEKRMQRFDPSQPGSSQYEIPQPEKPKKRKKEKKKDNMQQDVEEKEQDIQPVVSKDVFYKVSNDLKDTFQNQQEFSLLSAFNRNSEIEPHEDENEFQTTEIDKNKKNFGENPFHYDSSSDESEKDEKKVNNKQNSEQTTDSLRFITEPFFFKEDDFRLSEGSDFVLRMGSEKNNAFAEQRQNLKQIARTKIRNNNKKKDPFRKKLGGKKSKKMVRIKKAMKR